MLRINLLPASVAQRRIAKKMTALFSLLFLIFLIGPLAYNLAVQKPHQAEIEQQATEAEAGKAKTDALKAQAAAQVALIAPIKAKVDFVKQVYANNRRWPQLYATVARYTNSDILYSDAAVSGQTMSIKAYTPSIAAVGRYLQTMYKEPDFTTVAIDRLPGYPDALVSKYYYHGKLVGVGAPPGGSPGAGAGGGAAGFGGGGGGYPGGGGAGGGKGGPGGATATGLSTSGGGSGPSGGSGFGGSGFGGGAGSSGDAGTVVSSFDSAINPLASPEQRARLFAQAIRQATGKWNGSSGVRREPKGFEITVTATLKDPPVAPVVPGSGAAGGPGGGAPGGGFPGGGSQGSSGGYPGGGYPGSGG